MSAFAFAAFRYRFIVSFVVSISSFGLRFPSVPRNSSLSFRVVSLSFPVLSLRWYFVLAYSTDECIAVYVGLFVRQCHVFDVR